MARIIPIPIGPIYDGGPCRGIIHVIKAGDTLYQLGKQYHVSVGQLMFANPFVNVYNLQIGDELCIPVSIQPRNQEEVQPWERMPEETKMRPWEMGTQSGEMMPEEMEMRPWEITPQNMEEDEMQEDRL